MAVPSDPSHAVLAGVSHEPGEFSRLHRALEAARDIGDLNAAGRDLGIADNRDETVTTLAASTHPGSQASHSGSRPW